ncbi:type II toxin-antitoxin system RelE/ParE family toxin [Candidatus Tisiphia endosymbiont of Psammoecus bipunctatus]
MSKNNFCLTVQAEQDIKDIWLYIAKNNPKAAEKIAKRANISISCSN